MSWSPDGQLLASTAFDTVTIWNRDGTLRETLRDERVGNDVLTVSWHRNGRIIASGDGNAGVTLWDLYNKSVLSRFKCSDWVQSVEWNPVDERFLAAGCKNRAGAYRLGLRPDKKVRQ